MKRFLFTLALGVGTAAGVALAQEAPQPTLPTKVLYTVPNSTSPDGKYTLTAYEQDLKGHHYADGSDVGFYFTQKNGQQVEIASNLITLGLGTEWDEQGYGANVLAWSRDRGPDGSLQSNFVAINDKWYHYNDLRFLRLVNGLYVKQAYSEETYAKAEEAALADAAKKAGLDTSKVFSVIENRSYLSDTPGYDYAPEFENQQELSAALSFREPIYVIHRATYQVGENDKDTQVFRLTSIVKIARDEKGNLKDTKFGIKVESE